MKKLICLKCAMQHNGKLPHKYIEERIKAPCFLCRNREKVAKPSFYGLTDKLEPIASYEAGLIKKKKHKKRKYVKKKKIRWLCPICAYTLGATTNRLHCAEWREGTCDICLNKTKVTEPHFYELYSLNLNYNI